MVMVVEPEAPAVPCTIEPWELKIESADLGDGDDIFRLNFSTRLASVALDMSTMRWTRHAVPFRFVGPDAVLEAEIIFPRRRVAVRRIFCAGSVWGITTADHGELRNGDGVLTSVLDAMCGDLSCIQDSEGGCSDMRADSFFAPGLLPDEHTFVLINGVWHDLTDITGVSVVMPFTHEPLILGVRIEEGLAHEVVVFDHSKMTGSSDILDSERWHRLFHPHGCEQITHIEAVESDTGVNSFWLTYTAVSQACRKEGQLTTWSARVYTGHEQFILTDDPALCSDLPSEAEPRLSMMSIGHDRQRVRLYGSMPRLPHLSRPGR